MSVSFLLTALVVVITPGTGALYTMRAALSRGPRAGVVAAFACTLGAVPHLLAAITGLAALLNASALAFQAVKYLGVAYLLYVAWTTYRDRDPLAVAADPAPPRAVRLLVSGVLVNVLNPKLTIFFFAFLPQFVHGGDPAPRMIELGAVFMALTFVVFAGYGWFAAAVRDRLLARPRTLTWTRRGLAGAFVALAAGLAVSDG